jgi:hypothetical protein
VHGDRVFFLRCVAHWNIVVIFLVGALAFTFNLQ